MSTLSIPYGLSPPLPQIEPAAGSGLAGKIAHETREAGDINIVGLPLGPTDIGACWLPDIEKRILASTFEGGSDFINDGTTLPRDVVETALAFFHAASDLLPTKPYVYSSLQGDLVAEFRTANANVVTVVRRDSVTAYGAHLSLPVRFQFARGEPLAMRRSALKFSEQIPMREDADLDSRAE